METNNSSNNLKVGEGWRIDICAIPANSVADVQNMWNDTVLFSAVNLIKGEEVTLEYIDVTTGYLLIRERVKRENAAYKWTEERKVITEKSTKVYVEIINLLQSILSNGKNVLPIKPYGGWIICLNEINCRLRNKRDRIIFLSIKNRFFLEITEDYGYENSYKITIGICKYKMNSILYELNNIESINIGYAKSIEELSVFTGHYFVDPDKYMSSHLGLRNCF